MNDTDSLLVFRLQSLKKQPKTIRGCCILWYASLNERPCMRVFLVTVFSIFTLIHSFSFLAMLYLHFVHWEVSNLLKNHFHYINSYLSRTGWFYDVALIGF